ncbi:olfactory receptor 5V1-like [Prinia subflava]|uniref:olfactory receptor 5V1-like n=1 Tax=Prinia subflava TaxID=208062 RepID=UPI002FE1EE6E
MARERREQRDTNSSCNSNQQLRPATSGSLGMDVAAAVDVTIMPMHPHKIPTGLTGPILINGQPLQHLVKRVAAVTNTHIIQKRNITYTGCAAQVFLFIFLMSIEYFLLTSLCYDRYVSICKPLHYGTLLDSRACAHMAAAAWPSAFLNALMQTTNTFSLPLCQGCALGQFFCEIPPSSSSPALNPISGNLVSLQIVPLWYLVVLCSGGHKAISTCLPHLAVVSLFLSTAVFAYLNPLSIFSLSLDLALSVLYLVLPPALNPLIYSLRDQEAVTDSEEDMEVDVEEETVEDMDLDRELDTEEEMEVDEDETR